MDSTKIVLTNGVKRRVVYDGRKAINPWDTDDSPEAWTGLDAKPDSAKLVPVLYAAWQLRCKAIADLPFAIYDDSDDVVDSSDDYRGVVKCLPNPSSLFWMAEAALVGYGKAYFFNERNRSMSKKLQYWMPTSVNPVYHEITGALEKFERTTQAGKKDWKPEDVLYIWLPDPAVEIGPPTMWPLLTALTAAGALDKINLFVKDFMERGAVKALLLGVTGGMPPEGEKKKTEAEWNKASGGVRGMFWRMFNKDRVEPIVVGEGLDALRGMAVTDNLQKQILTGMGVPASLALANAANYATAQQDERNFITQTIIPDARLISGALNEQVLSVQGYRLQFEPERMEAFQEEETGRAGALSQLVAAQIPTKLALEILGYDLTKEQWAMLDEKPEPQPAEVAESDTAQEPDTEMKAELKRWQRKALKHIGQDVSFDSDTIPLDLQSTIHNGLPACKSDADVRVLFGQKPEALSVIEAIRHEMEMIKRVSSTK